MRLLEQSSELVSVLKNRNFMFISLFIKEVYTLNIDCACKECKYLIL
jgi:hypothetical protein